MNSRGKIPKTSSLSPKASIRTHLMNDVDSNHAKSKVWTLGQAKIGINVITGGKTSPEQQFNELWTWPLSKQIMRPGWISSGVNWEPAWAPSLGLCLQQPWGRSHWDQERRAALWQLIRTLPGTFGTPMCKSLFYANDFLQMFWNVLTVLVWFSKALMVWFEGNSSRSCSSEPIQDLPGHPAATGYGGANSCLPQENKIR